jgi:hypothetical protein
MMQKTLFDVNLGMKARSPEKGFRKLLYKIA